MQEHTTLIAELSYALATSKCSVEGMSNIVLNYARAVSGSRNGYVSLIHEESGDNIVYTLSSMIGHGCIMKENKKGIVFPKGKDGRYPSLWGHCLNTKKAFYTNDPLSHIASQGFPSNHIVISNFLSVPIMMGNALLGQISLANNQNGYNEEDVRTVQLISSHFALAVHRQKEVDFLKDAYKKELIREKTKQIKAVSRKIDSSANADTVNDLRDEIYMLNMLMKHKDAAREQLESNIRENIRKLILPYLNQLRGRVDDPESRSCLDVIHQNILEVFSPVINTLVGMSIQLTPQEAQVVVLIKTGMQTKEICEAMNISANTVNFHRKNIRAKLGLTNKRLNLRTYLCSLDEDAVN